jgi:hypothetical protein
VVWVVLLTKRTLQLGRRGLQFQRWGRVKGTYPATALRYEDKEGTARAYLTRMTRSRQSGEINEFSLSAA